MTNGGEIRFFRSLLNGYAGTDEEIAKEPICPYEREETCQSETDCFTCRLQWLRMAGENRMREDAK